MSVPQLQASAFMRPHWTDQERANATAVIEFVQLLMNDHDFDAVLQLCADQHYRQHHRSMADDIGGVVSTLRNLVKSAPDFSYYV